MSGTNYAEIWNRYEFEPTIPEEPPNMCVYAAKFAEWVQELCTNVAQNPSIVAINQSKILLLDKYAQWKVSLPRRHRVYTGDGHVCIYHVCFEMGYDRLRVLELALTPPMLFLPPPPLPPPPPAQPLQISGIFLGEEE